MNSLAGVYQGGNAALMRVRKHPITMNDSLPSDGSDHIGQQLAAFAAAHIAADTDCFASVDALSRARSLARCLRTVDAADAHAPALDWWSRARTVLATLVLDESMIAGAGLRGGSIRTMEFVRGGVHVDLEVEPLIRHTTRRGIVRGQVESGADCDGVPVVLVDESGHEAASTTLDDLGFFSVFLPSGTYSLAIALPAGAIMATGVCVQ